MTDLSDVYDQVERLHLTAGWARQQRSVWAEPDPIFLPTVWRFADARAALEQFGDSVSTEAESTVLMAERRNLLMVNPTEGNTYATSRNLIAAYQMIMPGERARTHRHSPTALRVCLDIAEGTYTVVDGARIEMATDDVVLTPNWYWHGHGNSGTTNSYWIDFLDVPLVQHLESMFIEWWPEHYQPIDRHEPDSPLRLRPDTLLSGGSSETIEIGTGVLPTIGLELNRRPTGSTISRERSTENNVYVVLRGSGRFDVPAASMTETLVAGDVFSIPCWYEHSVEALDDSLFLRVSDEPLIRTLGFLRGKEWEISPGGGTVSTGRA